MSTIVAGELQYTADDLLAMTDDADRFELVAGKLVPMPPFPGAFHGSVSADY